MITIYTKNIKSFSIITYKNLIKNLAFHNLTCTCGISGNLVKHGSYKRYLKLPTGKEVIDIHRVICKSCNKTHAILPDFIVPYSNISLQDHISIISSLEPSKVMENNPEVDESNIRYILNKFKSYWKHRLISFKISINNELIKNCFRYFGRQFMQIKCTSNILFFETT